MSFNHKFQAHFDEKRAKRVLKGALSWATGSGLIYLLAGACAYPINQDDNSETRLDPTAPEGAFTDAPPPPPPVGVEGAAPLPAPSSRYFVEEISPSTYAALSTSRDG